MEALSPAASRYRAGKKGAVPVAGPKSPNAPSQASVYQAIPQSPRRFVQRLKKSQEGDPDPVGGVAGRTAMNMRRIKAKKPAWNAQNDEYERGRNTGEYGPNSTMVKKGKIPRNYH